MLYKLCLFAGFLNDVKQSSVDLALSGQQGGKTAE